MLKNKLLVKKIINLANKNNYHLASSESFTAGLISRYLTLIPGSSKVFVGAIVAYQKQMKQNLLNIKNVEIISSKCAHLMALKTTNLLKSDITIATTGNAGPTAMENKSIGEVYISIYVKKTNQFYDLNCKIINLGRNYITNKATILSLKFLYKIIKEIS